MVVGVLLAVLLLLLGPALIYLYCLRIVRDEGNRIKVEWFAEPNAKITTNINRNVRVDAEKAISKWSLDGIMANRQAKNLIKLKTVRIDIQGMIILDGGNINRYANIKKNSQRHHTGPDTSTTMANALVPVGIHIPCRYIRDALLQSLNTHDRVELRVTDLKELCL